MWPKVSVRVKGVPMSELLLDLVKSTKVVGKSTKVDATVQWNAGDNMVNGVSVKSVPDTIDPETGKSLIDIITAHGVVTALGTIAPFSDRLVPGRAKKGVHPMVPAKLVNLGGGVSVGWRKRAEDAGDWVSVVVTETLTAADLGF